MVDEVMGQIFATSVRPKCFNLLPKLVLNFSLELFELIKRVRLMSHQIDITKSTVIVSKSDEVSESLPGNGAHGPTYVSVYQAQQVTCPLTLTDEGRSCHLVHQARFAYINFLEFKRTK